MIGPATKKGTFEGSLFVGRKTEDGQVSVEPIKTVKALSVANP
jgi:hypothetical protein